MPVTIQLPQPDNRVGPGLGVAFQTDFVGPMPTGSYWRARIDQDAEGDHSIFYVNRDFTTNSDALIWLWFENGPVGEIPGWMVAPGATVHVNIELVNGTTNLVEDSGSQTAVWEPVGGLGYLQRLYYDNPRALGEGDAAKLDTILAATAVSIPSVGAIGGVVAIALGQLLSNLPPRFGSRHGFLLISGQGSISVNTDPFRVDAIGMEWRWDTIPPGFGLALGSVGEYFNRVVQFRLIGADFTHSEFQLDVVDTSTEFGRYMWAAQQPIRVEWFVAPGCVVELEFLVLALG